MDLRPLKTLLDAINADPEGKRAQAQHDFTTAQAAWRKAWRENRKDASVIHRTMLVPAREAMRTELKARHQRAEAARQEVARIVQQVVDDAKVPPEEAPATAQQALDSLEVSLSEGRTELDGDAWQRKPVPPEKERRP